MEKIPFIQGEANQSKYPINCFFSPESLNGMNSMIGTPGLTEKVDPSLSFPVRGMKADKDRNYLYAVVGNRVLMIDKAWNVYTASARLNTNVGHVYMEPNLTQMMIVDDIDGYIVTRSGTTPTLAEIASSGFLSPTSLTMLDNYFITSVLNTFNIQFSGLSDGTSWSALDIKTAEGDPDNVTRVIADHRQLFAFGPKSGEVFYNAGTAFQRFPDVHIELGIGAAASAHKADNTIFYFDDKFVLRKISGFTPVVMSPPKLNQLIQALTTKSDAICYSYTRQGNIFIVMIFPTEDVTYVLNLATGFVHQWASGVNIKRHRSNCHEYFNGLDLVGDYENGKIYSIDEGVYTDNTAAIKRIYYSPKYHHNNLLIFHKLLDLDFKTGVGLQSGQGEDPMVMLRYSDDGMSTWSNEAWVSIGKQGEYDKITRWTQLGSSRGRIYEISMTDPVLFQFTEAAMNLEVGRG